MKRIVLSAIAAVMAVTGLSACGQGSTYYHPAAYGQNGHCYYINNPAEAIALQHAGLCPNTWLPMQAPLAWQEMYYPYYSSPAYYNAYVPVGLRRGYITSEQSFGRTYHSAILTAERSAVYKSNTGKTTTYSKISSGGGTRTSFGSGTRCDVVSNALLKPQFQHPAKGGGGGGFGGGSRGGYSGGSRSGSGSGSRTGTRTGC